MRPVTEGNLTDFFVTGEEAFADLADRLEADGGKDARAYLLGWSCDINVPLRSTPSPTTGTTLGQLLSYFVKQGGVVHGMLWDNTLMANAGCADAVNYINALPGGSSAILDRRTPLAGTHHQKIQIVVPARGHLTESTTEAVPAVAYCGGMDVFNDRIGPNGLHDVHCKIRGPAADDLVKVFQDRWNDHPARSVDLKERTSVASFGGNALVQVCCTYPMFQSPLLYSLIVGRYLPAVNQQLQGSGAPTAGDMRVGGSIKLYGFYDTSKGVQQIWHAVKKGIAEAKSYIYLEDQYLINKWVGDALAAKLAATKDEGFRIVIVVLHPDSADVEQVWPRRRDVFAKLLALDPRRKRWTVVYRRGDKPHPYVHSKTWIFDDELVITGSANADRRGYTYNSETDVVVAGDVSGSGATAGATTIAQDLRARLFAKHLGGKPADHINAGTSLRKFFGDLARTSVAVFDPSARVGAPDKYLAKLLVAPTQLVSTALTFMPGRPEDWLWDYLEDPDSNVQAP